MAAPVYYEDFQRTIARLVEFCRQRVGIIVRGFNVQAFYRKLREHAGASGNVGPTVVDIAFLLFLLEKVREVKKRSSK